MDIQLILCLEKKRTTELETEVKRLSKLLAESCSEREKVLGNKQTMEDTVAAKVDGEKRVVQLM